MPYLFDPRENKLVKTDNDALIIADAMIRLGCVEPDENFWEKIKLIANYIDSGNGVGKLVNKEFKKEFSKKINSNIKVKKPKIKVKPEITKRKAGRPKGSKNKKRLI